MNGWSNGKLLYHTNCPNCGSRDNLAVYEDHTHCYGCKQHIDKITINPQLINKIKKNKKNDNNTDLPDDYSRHLPLVALEWLKQYEITAQETHKHRMGWSNEGKVIFKDTKRECDYKPLLIFPVYDIYGNLTMWQARYFGDNPKAPKYYTRGAKDVIHMIGEHGPIVLVEDLISAIKIGRNHRAIPLWGSSINLDLLVRLHHMTDSFLIWLDRDKFKDAQKAANRARQYFKHVEVIATDLDPKCYDNHALQTIIGVNS